jgi:hypothetical protein
MPRKKRDPIETQTAQPQEIAATETSTAVAEAEPAASQAAEVPKWIDGPPTPVNGFRTASAPSEHGKHWGDPYKSIFTCREMGFELGEDRRFKQRVFKFALKPTADVLAELKGSGFTYRASEKAWTIPATAETRKMTDELARHWAGPHYVQGMER